MDVKDISGGDYYTTKILNGIHESDLYLIFISNHSLKSTWVNAEIDFALQEKIERKRPIIVPILLEDVDIPVPLKNMNYLDARFSVQQAANEFSAQYGNTKVDHDRIVMSSMAFTISKDTFIEVGPLNDSTSTKDLAENRNQILDELRKQAYGILMNFVSATEFDFQSDRPRFTNGVYEETVVKKAGSLSGSICENISVEAVVFSPDIDKVDRLLQKRWEILDINAITFGFSIPCKREESMFDVGKRCFQKIQNNYIILSYSVTEGVKIELSKGFYLSLTFSDELLKIKLSTKNSFELKKKIQEFSVFNFIKEFVL